MMAARIFRGLESKQMRACAAHDSAPSKKHILKMMARKKMFIFITHLTSSMLFSSCRSKIAWNCFPDIFPILKHPLGFSVQHHFEQYIKGNYVCTCEPHKALY